MSPNTSANLSSLYFSTTKSLNFTAVVFSSALSNIIIEVLVDVFSNWS